MNIAYLIIANKNPMHLSRLINALDSEHVSFFIHIDKKSSVHFTIPKKKNIYVLKNNIPVYWGGFSQIQATMLLLKEAKKMNTYHYYVLLSGSDFPVRSNTYIMDFLKKYNGKEFINFSEMPLHNKTFDRLKYVYFEGSQTKIGNSWVFLLNKFVRMFGIKRTYPKRYSHFKLYAGSQWWMLDDDCVTYILNFVIDNPSFVRFYSRTYIPDEMFFHTIIGNSKFKDKIANACTYADWNEKKRPLPAKITEEHIPLLRKRSLKTVYGNGKFTPLFARKFFDDSATVLKKIHTVRLDIV